MGTGNYYRDILILHWATARLACRQRGERRRRKKGFERNEQKKIGAAFGLLDREKRPVLLRLLSQILIDDSPPLLRGLAWVVVGLFGVVDGGGNEGNGPFPVAARIQPSQKAF